MSSDPPQSPHILGGSQNVELLNQTFTLPLMKICLFGASGLLGSEFKKIFEREHFDFVSPSSQEVDIRDFEAVNNFLAEEKIEKIVLCAAWTDVEGAEVLPEKCEALNVGVVENLVKSQIPILHFSSDYVFEVPDGREIPEDFERQSHSVYGRSKIKAEQVLERSGIAFQNIRTSWLFGAGGKNFITTILNAAEKFPTLKIIEDQVGRPTFAKDLAEAVTTTFLLEKIPPSVPPFDKGALKKIGHFHFQNSGEPVSWAGLAEYFLTQKKIKTPIQKISSKEWGNICSDKKIAVRPKYSVLKNSSIFEPSRDWKEAVNEFLRELK